MSEENKDEMPRLIKPDSRLAKMFCKHEYRDQGLFRKMRCSKCNSEIYIEKKELEK